MLYKNLNFSLGTDMSCNSNFAIIVNENTRILAHSSLIDEDKRADKLTLFNENLYHCLLSEQILQRDVLFSVEDTEPLLSTVLLKISSPLSTNTITAPAVLGSGS